MNPFKVGDILHATYSYSSQHNYWLRVTRVTPKTVDLERLEREIVSGDGYGQNGEEKPLILHGIPVPSKRIQEYKAKRIKYYKYDGQPYVSIGEYIGGATLWDGVSSSSFYTD